MTVDEWDQVFAINVRGSMLKVAAPRGGGPRRVKGAIVNISSGASRSARASGSHYTGSKAAVNTPTRGDARPTASRSGLPAQPDDVVTAENAERHPYINMMLKGTPLGRTGHADDVAEAVFSLRARRLITGAMLEVTGGSHCGRTHAVRSSCGGQSSSSAGQSARSWARRWPGPAMRCASSRRTARMSTPWAGGLRLSGIGRRGSTCRSRRRTGGLAAAAGVARREAPHSSSAAAARRSPRAGRLRRLAAERARGVPHASDRRATHHGAF
jgi:hypothetical protein